MVFMLLKKLLAFGLASSCTAQGKCYSQDNLLLHNDTDIAGKAYGIVDVPINFTMRFSILPFDVPSQDADIFWYVSGAFDQEQNQPARIAAKFVANTTAIRLELDQALNETATEHKFRATTVDVPLNGVTQVKIIRYGSIISASFNDSVVLRSEIRGHYYGNSTLLIANSKLTHVMANLRLREIKGPKVHAV